MAQKREKSTLRKLIDEHDIKDLAGVQDLVKGLTSGLIQEIMDAELEEEPYSVHNQSSNTNNLQPEPIFLLVADSIYWVTRTQGSTCSNRMPQQEDG